MCRYRNVCLKSKIFNRELNHCTEQLFIIVNTSVYLLGLMSILSSMFGTPETGLTASGLAFLLVLVFMV